MLWFLLIISPIITFPFTILRKQQRQRPSSLLLIFYSPRQSTTWMAWLEFTAATACPRYCPHRSRLDLLTSWLTAEWQTTHCQDIVSRLESIRLIAPSLLGHACGPSFDFSEEERGLWRLCAVFQLFHVVFVSPVIMRVRFSLCCRGLFVFFFEYRCRIQTLLNLCPGLFLLDSSFYLFPAKSFVLRKGNLAISLFSAVWSPCLIYRPLCPLFWAFDWWDYWIYQQVPYCNLGPYPLRFIEQFYFELSFSWHVSHLRLLLKIHLLLHLYLHFCPYLVSFS